MGDSSLICQLGLTVELSLYFIVSIVVPPKRGRPKSHPYQPAPRRSTRQVIMASRQEQDGGPAPLPDDQPPQPAVPQAPQVVPQAPQVQVEPVPSTSQVNPGPVQSATQVEASQSQVVSRQEFQELQQGVSSIREMISSFFASVNPMSSGPTPAPRAGAQVSDVVPASPIPVIVSQPVSSMSGDPRLPAQNFARAEDNVDQVVRLAASQHIQSIVQGPDPGKPRGEKPSHQLDGKVKQSVIQDIWEDKYVDLNLLLDKKVEPYRPLKLVVDEHGEHQYIPVNNTKEISTIGIWSRAFDIYTSLYSRKFPDQTHNLLTYSNKIKDLAFENGDFVKYDREFRMTRSKYNLPWEIPDMELWGHCSLAGIKTQINKINTALKLNNEKPFLGSPSSGGGKDKLKHPKGYCYNYHNKGRCGRPNCNFIHTCYATGCNQEHSAITIQLNNIPTLFLQVLLMHKLSFWNVFILNIIN